MEVVSKASKGLTVSYNKSDWLEDGDTYYYTKPVQPGQSTTELLNASIQLTKDGGNYQVVDVFAEAIQSLPIDAVESAWGVVINGNGIITSIK